MKVKSTTKRVIRCAAAVSALSAMVCFAGVAEASAATAEQVNATTDSITVKFNFDPKYQNVQMGAVEYKQNSSDEWKTVPADNIGTPNTQEAVLTNLNAGTKAAQIKFNYTYNNAGSSYVLRTYAMLYDPTTVAEKTSGLEIADQLSYTKKLMFGFKAPAALGGYEIQLKAKSGSKNNVNYKYSYSNNCEPSRQPVTTAYVDAKLNTAYTAKIRTYAIMDDSAKTKVYSEWSDPVVLVPQPVVKGKRYSNYTNLTWTKISGAKKYTVYASTKSKGGFKKVATTKTNKCTVKKIGGKKVKGSKQYYYYAIAHVTQGGKTYTSPALKCFY